MGTKRPGVGRHSKRLQRVPQCGVQSEQGWRRGRGHQHSDAVRPERRRCEDQLEALEFHMQAWLQFGQALAGYVARKCSVRCNRSGATRVAVLLQRQVACWACSASRTVGPGHSARNRRSGRSGCSCGFGFGMAWARQPPAYTPALGPAGHGQCRHVRRNARAVCAIPADRVLDRSAGRPDRIADDSAHAAARATCGPGHRPRSRGGGRRVRCDRCLRRDRADRCVDGGTVAAGDRRRPLPAVAGLQHLARTDCRVTRPWCLAGRICCAALPAPSC